MFSARDCPTSRDGLNPAAWRIRVIVIEITHLEPTCRNAGSNRNRGGKLCGLYRAPPERRSADNLLRHDDDIARVEFGGKNLVIGPASRGAADNRTIGANDEGILSTGRCICTSGATQIPVSVFAWCKRDSGRVVYLAGDKHEAGPLRNGQHIAPAQLDICRRIRPAIDVGTDVNHHAAGRRMSFQIVDDLILLRLDELQPASASNGRREPCRRRVCLDLGNELLAALLFELAYLLAGEHRSIGVSRIAESSSTAQNRTKSFPFLKSVRPWEPYLSNNRYRFTNVVPSGDLVDRQNISWFERNIRTRIGSIHRCTDRNRCKFSAGPISIDNSVAGQIGAVEQRIALETASHAYQLCGCHVLRQRIGSRPKHLTLDLDLRRISFIATEDANGIERLEIYICISNEHVRHIKLDGFRMEIRRYKPYDLTMRGGLRQHVAVAVQYIAEAHAVGVG